MINKIEVGLDQELSMPDDSYVIDFFKAQKNKLEVGAPVYFIINGKYDYALNSTFVCSGSKCDANSAVNILNAAVGTNLSYISDVPSSWIDDYLDWGRDDNNCCQVHPDGSFCPSSNLFKTDQYCLFIFYFIGGNTTGCSSCQITESFEGRFNVTRFYSEYLEYFLHDIPSSTCAKG